MYLNLVWRQLTQRSSVCCSSRISQACELAECCHTTVTEIEEGLTDVVSIPEVVSHEWIDDSLDDVTQRITQLTSHHSELQVAETKTKVG